MGSDPPHGTDPGKLSTQGRNADNKETSKETGGGGLVITTAVGSDGGSGLRGYQGLYLK